mgnify:CR=1 FL=1
MNTAQHIYTQHHKDGHRHGMSIMANERGARLAIDVGTNKDVLDLGCRDGVLTSFFAAENRVLGVDVDLDALAKAEKALGIETRFLDAHGDWDELEGQTFDLYFVARV